MGKLTISMAIFISFLYVYQRVIGPVFAQARTSPEEIFQEFISKYGGAGSHLSVHKEWCRVPSEAFETHVKQAFVPQKSIKKNPWDGHSPTKFSPFSESPVFWTKPWHIRWPKPWYRHPRSHFAAMIRRRMIWSSDQTQVKGYQSSTHQTSRICRSLHGNHRQIWTHRAAPKSCFFASLARAGAADAPRHDEVCGRFRPTIDLWAADAWRLMVELTNQKKPKYGFDHRKWRFDHMNNGCWVCPKLRIPPCCGSFGGNLMIHSQVYVFGVTHSDKTPKNSEKTSKSAMFFSRKPILSFHSKISVSPWKSPGFTMEITHEKVVRSQEAPLPKVAVWRGAGHGRDAVLGASGAGEKKPWGQKPWNGDLMGI